MSYAGHKTHEEAWTMLMNDNRAVLVDVRTPAEWNYVGFPDISQCGKETRFVMWVEFPAMTKNQHFADQVREFAPNCDTPILFLCRSGVRSVAASEAMTSAGYSACYNILQGFEGDINESRHRGTIGGWKAAGLPWVQS